jgi:hypothetical protein
MKTYKYILLFFLCILLKSCTPKLSSTFIQENERIYAEQRGSYFPSGSKGLSSPNYPGILALGDNEFFFDAQGPGSRPWMDPIAPFRFQKSEILNTNLSEEKAFKKKELTINTSGGNTYEFLISDADIFSEKLKRWKNEN